MVTFDSADRNVCTVKRQATSTPLQALALLNDTQHVEAARFLGQRMLKEGGKEIGTQASWGFRMATGRSPSEKERALLTEIFTEQRELFAKQEQAAVKLLSVGEAVNDPGLPLADLAAATVLAQAILNHDESVNRR
jgi:hypothetical protein